MDLEQVVLDLAPQAEERRAQRRAKVCRVGAGGEMEHTPELVRSPLVDEIVPVDVSQVMTPDPITVGPEVALKEVARLLQARGVSGVPVVADECTVGVVSTGDILLKERGQLPHVQRSFHDVLAWATPRAKTKLAARTAGDAMTSPVHTVAPTDAVAAAARTMLDRRIHRLPVVDKSRHLAGIVTRSDLLRAFARSDEEISREIDDLVRIHSFWVAPHDPVDVAVLDGDVTLAGSVDTKTTAELLPELIARVPGVISVSARLRWTEPPAGVDPDREYGFTRR